MSVRLQIYLTGDQYRKLKEKSRLSGKSMAEHIRESLNRYLDEEEPAETLPGDPIWQIAGRGKSNVTDLSTAHDRHLYARGKGEGG